MPTKRQTKLIVEIVPLKVAEKALLEESLSPSSTNYRSKKARARKLLDKTGVLR